MATIVYIGTNTTDWIPVGSIGGSTSGVDIDAYIGSGVTLWEQYSYVMIVETDPPGAPDTGYPFAGTDIDAVGAISSAPPVSDVPDGGSTGVLVGLALLGLARVRRMR